MGLANASRGEGRGEVKGDAMEDLARVKAGGAFPKLEAGAELTPVRGGDPRGVEVRDDCHGAGEHLRMTVCRR